VRLKATIKIQLCFLKNLNINLRKCSVTSPANQGQTKSVELQPAFSHFAASAAA
jgi:hypothetical protein